MKIKIGITGQDGFVGKHLYNTLNLFPEKFETIAFHRDFFQNDSKMDDFTHACNVIVHLAAMNRHPDANVIYNTNIDLVTKLISSLNRTKSKAHVLFSSSSQEEKDNLYGKSKLEGRQLLSDWAKTAGAKFTGLIIPNVFGPFGKPDYNSVIATFSHKLINNEVPEIKVDGNLNLIYINELVSYIIQQIENGVSNIECKVPFTSVNKVSDILALLTRYNKEYHLKGTIPSISSKFEYDLFNTFRSFIYPMGYFPIKHIQNEDNRGAFTEIIRVNVGGQFSYSTTHPGITRGNHFHLRKIERFSVIKGKALIQLRRIGTSEVLDFYLDGDEPAYVDMPVWYTHNIKNIGDSELYTLFWINEFYDPADPDTYFETV